MAKTRRFFRGHAGFLAMALIAVAPDAWAISNDEVNAGVQFSFANPGARSLGLGGAFTGLADDATAAYANPAGLTILRTQEFAFEARYTSYDTPFTSGGRVGFSPFDTSALGQGRSSDSVFQPSYASWVFPTEKLTFALYYQRLADFESKYSTAGVAIDLGDGATDVIFPVNTGLEFDIENIGGAIGWKLSDSFSLGLSLAYSDFQIDSRTVRPDLLNQQLQSGGDSDWVYGLGALWRVSDRWNFGLAYRRGGEFRYDAANETLPGNSEHPTINPLQPAFDVPHILSAGLAFRPTDAWLITLDINRVYYSELTHRTSPDLFILGSTEPVPLEVEDGTEVRLGVEYAFLNMQHPLFLRGGAWRDPAHRIELFGDSTDNCDEDFFTCVDATLFRPGDDEWHYSLGLGLAFEKFQFDAAVDFSDLVDTYSVSGVLRF